MRARATLTIVALGLAIAALVVTETGQPVAAQSAPIEVGFGAFHFEPAELTVPVGQTVFNLTNLDSQRRHNMVIDVNGTVMESETLGASTAGVWEVMLDQPGTYDFWCSVSNHRERGMVGKITVGDAPAAEQLAEQPAGAMTESITLWMLWIHVPFAVAWIGIALIDAFLAVAPGLSAAQRASLIRMTTPAVLVAIPVIIITGVWQTVYNPITASMWSLQILDELKKSTYGWALFYKHVFVVGTLLATLAIKLVLVRRLEASAPTAAVAETGSGAAVALTDNGVDRQVQAGAWLNVLCCLAILVCVVLMVWQLH